MSEIIDIPVIKKFIVNGVYYLYDTYTNRLINIQKEHYIELGKIQKLGITKYLSLKHNDKPYKDILALINKGFLKPPHIESIQHIETKYVKHLINRCLNHVTLQVTRDCNFSCRYCLYASNSQVERAHEKKNMSWKTAKGAIDYMYAHSADAQEVYLSFYGGEPLLNFPLIKKAVLYSEELFRIKPVNYNMTINGALLSDNILHFLVKYNFDLTISLDGTREIHNSHRRFLDNGNGTFDVVFNNVLHIKNAYSEFFKNHVTFNPVLFKDESFDDAYRVFSEIGVSIEDVYFRYASLNGIDYINSKYLPQVSNSEVMALYKKMKSKL